MYFQVVEMKGGFGTVVVQKAGKRISSVLRNLKIYDASYYKNFGLR